MNLKIHLSYERGFSEYRATIERELWSKKVKYMGKDVFISAVPALLGFRAKYEITDQGSKKLLYWRTKSDDVAIKLMAASADWVSVSDEIKEVLTKASSIYIDSRSVDAEILPEEYPGNSEGYIPRGYQKAGAKFIVERWRQSIETGVQAQPILC